MKNDDTNVIVRMPDKVEIILVQANELKNYELFQWLIILLAPIASVFWTAYFVEDKNLVLIWSAIIFYYNNFCCFSI